MKEREVDKEKHRQSERQTNRQMNVDDEGRGNGGRGNKGKV